MIMSYHQCHYREDHMAPSRVNGGRVFIHERRERARRAGYHRGGICGHRTFLSHARLPSTSLCGPDEDWGGAGGAGGVGKKVESCSSRVRDWTFSKTGDQLWRSRKRFAATQKEASARAGAPVVTGTDGDRVIYMQPQPQHTCQGPAAILTE